MAYDYHARNDDTGLRLGGLLLVSVVLHALLVPWLVQRALPEDVPPLESVRSIEPMELVAVREPEREEDRVVQFVSLPEPPPDEQRTPENARFADQFDREVDRETVARNESTRPGAASSDPPEAQPSEPVPPEQTVARARRGTEEPPPSTSDAPARPERRRVRREASDPAAVEAAQDEEAAFEPSESTVEVPLPLRGSDGADGDDDADRVDLGAFFRAPVARADTPGGRRNDHIELEEGDRTALNSYRSMYWSFFHRMQEALSREWEPNRVLRRNDPSGRLHGDRDRYTVLAVTLNGDGSLRHTRVVRSSDLDFLDQEAIRAFQAAAPFHNVPEGLKDHNGQVTFQFGFHVSFSRNRNRIRRLDGF